MAQFFIVHPNNPQERLMGQAAEIIKSGGVIAYPTDSSYALGCEIGNKEGLRRIADIRKIDKDHNFTLVCKDLSELSLFAKVDNSAYRLLKSFTPGPYTFILDATREVPRMMQNAKRKTIGLRVPDYPVVSALLNQLSQPLLSSTLILPGEEIPMNDAETIREQLETQVELVIDSGPCDIEPTSVIDLTSGIPIVRREGKGDISSIQS